MIVELCGKDMLKLVNGEPLDIDGLIVRTTEGNSSSIVGGSAPTVPAQATLTGKQGGQRSKRPRKRGIHEIEARFPGNCFHPGCPTTWGQGANIVYDYDNRKPYCMGHGTPMLQAAAT